MNTKNILIYTSALNYRNGGNAAMLLYAKGFVELGKHVTIWADRKPTWKYLLEKHFNDLKNINIVNDLNQKSKFDLIISSFDISLDRLNQVLELSTKIMITHTGDYQDTKKMWYDRCSEAGIQFICESHRQNEILKEKGLSSILITPPCEEQRLNGCVHNSLDGALNMLYVGSLQHRKNQLHAANILYYLNKLDNRKHTLTLVGNIVKDQHYDQLVNFINSHSLQKSIKIAGFQRKYYRYYNYSNCIISTSRSEGFATSLREAMYLGKYIVASNIDGILGQLDQFVADIFDLKTDPKDVATMMLKSIKNGDAYTKSIAARERYIKLHSKEHFQRKIRQL